MIKYSFPSSQFTVKFRTAIITGVARSGKTTLGNILATYKSAEHSDEPWLLNTVPIMPQLGMMKKEAAQGMFAAYLDELANDMILLRCANFRRSDLSSIWAQKTRAEIYSRLVSLRSRVDVRNFIKKNKSLFLLTLNAEPIFNMLNIFEFLPQSKMVYVIRKGLDVAANIEGKKWLSDKDLTHPPHAQVFRATRYRNKTFYIPCWIKARDEKKFLAYTEYERALFYWCIFVENAIKTLGTVQKKRQCLVIKFEDLVNNPQKIMVRVSSFLHIKPSSITGKAVNKIKHRSGTPQQIPAVAKELVDRTKKLYNYFGYDWN